MKKVLLVALSLVLTLGLAACGGGDTYQVATDSNFVPFEFMNTETGEMDGFDIDLIKAIAEEAGIEIEIEPIEFDGVIAGMKSSRYDMGIAGMTITEERDAEFDFSDPYYDAGLILAVSSDNTEIKSIEDVDGKKVATRATTTSEDYLKENTDAEIVSFPDIVSAYEDLKSGRVDAVLYDAPNVMYYVKNSAGGEFKVIGDILQGEQYGISFPEDHELIPKVNEALATLKENGTYGDIYEKWFGKRPEGM